MSRDLAEPTFADDDGSLDPVLAGASSEVDILAALSRARVLVPVVAVSDNAPADGDKEADMAAVYTTGADGRRALLVFSSLATLQRWDTAARPVPVRGHEAAQASIDDGAHAMVLDIAGPQMYVVETEDIAHIAAGDALVRTSGRTVWVPHQTRDAFDHV